MNVHVHQAFSLSEIEGGKVNGIRKKVNGIRKKSVEDTFFWVKCGIYHRGNKRVEGCICAMCHGGTLLFRNQLSGNHK